MPDAIPLLVTTGVGVGVLAGLVSGVCYLISNGFGINRSNYYRQLQFHIDNDRCSVCRSKYQVIGTTAEPCSHCGQTYCRYTCGAYCKDNGKWSCKNCCNKKSVKFKGGLNFLNRIQKTLTFSGWMNSSENLHPTSVTLGTPEWIPSGVTSSSSSDSATRLQIRDFLEQLAAQLTGGPLDDVSVSRMYHHQQYLPQAMVSSAGVEHASTAHARLKRLVQRVIEEAMALPALLDYSGTNSRESSATPRLPDFDAKTYEDLLATAILNKVIDRYQQDYDRDRERSSGIHSESASPSGSHLDDEISTCLDKRAVESGLGIDRSTPSQSSVEPLSRDGSVNSENGDHFGRGMNIGDKSQLIPITYSSDEEYLEEKKYNNILEGALATIDFSHKNRVPFPEYGGDIIDTEVTQDLPYDEAALSDELHNNEYNLNGDIHSANNTWEENWLFQKKRLKTTQSVPVPMLVPNSNSEYKAMIGDRDADDTTDLSDAGSDEEDGLQENDIKKVLVNSKTIIGGKNLGSLLDLVDYHKDSENILKSNNVLVAQTENDLKIGHITMKASPTEAVEMLVEVDSGPLQKAEFNISEVHRGLARHEIESIKNETNLIKTPQTEFAYNLDTISPNGFNKNIDLENLPEATNMEVIIKNNEQLNSLQQKESEYSETIAIPVQRHLDSLRRITRDSVPSNLPPIPAPRIKDTDVLMESNVTNAEKQSGSIAVREKQKWLNAVPMPNNPYSAEAIEKRLSQKNSSLFDIITNGIPLEEKAPNLAKDTHSPPKSLQDALAEDIPVYKRYGRDYYIKEAKQSVGSRAKSPYLLQNNNNHSIDQVIKRDSPVSMLNGEDVLEIHVVTNGNSKEEHSDYNSNVFSARPVIIGTDEDMKSEIYIQTSYIDDSHIDNPYLEKNNNETLKSSDKENKSISSDLNTSDNLSDSISSTEDNMRIYNIQSGKVMTEKDQTVNYDSNCIKSVEIEGQEQIRYVSVPKVKDLAKMFANTHLQQNPTPPPRKKRLSIQEPDVEVINKNMSHLMAKQPVHMHSLTARSISKEFREELKLSMPTIQKIPGGVNEVPEGMDVPLKEQKSSSRPTSPQPVPGTLKSKLAFFERLNQR